MPTRTACLASWLLLATSLPTATAQSSRAAESRGSGLGAAKLSESLEDIRVRFALPALGAAIVTTDGLAGSWATGVRRNGSDERVTVDDRWHLGSCTKAMTATLIALLVERGDLAWDKTLPQLLPELARSIDPGFAEVTLVELLAHRAGLRTMTGRDEILARCQKLPGTPAEQRLALAEAVLSSPPATKPREQHEYSNAGLIIAGVIAERAAKKPWEALITELLFVPLGITTAGFGAPADVKGARRPEQPRGHAAGGTPIEPGPGADNPPLLGPAGTCHMSLADWARYLRLHLQGARGDVQVGAITLHAATFARLHTPYPGPGTRYGYGWGMPKRPWAAGDHTVLTHAGSNTRWYCVTWLDPAGGYGVLATTNIAGDGASKGVDSVCALLLEEWLARPRAGAASRPGTRPK